jgi:competence protein ComEA
MDPTNKDFDNISADPPDSSPWFLRRDDQRTVAVLTLLALVAIGSWSVVQWKMASRTIEIDSSERVAFEKIGAEPVKIGSEESQIDKKSLFQVDINEAKWPELAQLPRIGETTARRIVQDRKDHGPFKSIDDLTRIRGIGAKTVEKLRKYISPVLPTANSAK